MPSAAQNKATTQYVKKHMRRFTLQCHKEYDADVIAFLESKDNYNGYLKELLRRELVKEGK
jgi:hypothetical protein